MASSVLRQYTPPTCTLEISAKESPLSRWTNRSVLKHVRFQLSFDDPRLSPEEQVRVRGDRAQLEALHEAVTSYVQTLLNSAPAQFAQALSHRLPDADQRGQVPLNGANGSTTRHNGAGDRLSNLAANTSEPAPDTVIQNGSQNGELLQQEDAHGRQSFGIHLQPKGLLTHDLHLGVLESDHSGSVVHLSTLQLFDLANALDEFAAEALALPSLGRSSWVQSRSSWLRVAAVAVLAVGVTTAVSKFVMDVSSPTLQTASSEAPGETSGKLPDPAAGIAPTTQDPASLAPADPFATNLPTLPPPPPAGAIAQPSPGLPSVTVPRTATPVPAPPARTIPNLPQLAPVPQRVIPPSAPDAVASAPRAPQQLQIPAQQPNPNQAAESGTDNSDFAASARLAPAGEAAADAPEGIPPSTAFDTIPQVSQVRDYFQGRWQPPESLTQPLQYQLVLNPDGTIQQINPRGQVAGDYVDRTGLPLTGEPFVEPIESGQTARIRLVLDPDGRVQTFLEGLE